MSNNFTDLRLPLGKVLENKITKFFQDLDLIVIPTEKFKQSLTKEQPDVWQSDFLKKNKTILMLRYLPDLIVLDKSNKIESFFLDTKVMFTPVYLKTLPDLINKTLNENITLDNLGLIEREAYTTYMLYQKAGIKVAVLALCTYNPELIFCDYIQNIKTLFTEKQNRNYYSSGSTTPRVNIDFRKMSSFKNFLSKELKINNFNKFHELYKDLEKNFNFIGLPRTIRSETANEVKVYVEKKCNRKLIFKNLF